MTTKQKSLHYLRSGLTVLLGAGTTLAGSFLVSRLREKQDAESRLERLEQMLDDLGAAPPSPLTPSSVPPPAAGEPGASKGKKAPRKSG